MASVDRSDECFTVAGGHIGSKWSRTSSSVFTSRSLNIFGLSRSTHALRVSSAMSVLGRNICGITTPDE